MPRIMGSDAGGHQLAEQLAAAQRTTAEMVRKGRAQQLLGALANAGFGIVFRHHGQQVAAAQPMARSVAVHCVPSHQPGVRDIHIIDVRLDPQSGMAVTIQRQAVAEIREQCQLKPAQQGLGVARAGQVLQQLPITGMECGVRIVFVQQTHQELVYIQPQVKRASGQEWRGRRSDFDLGQRLQGAAAAPGHFQRDEWLQRLGFAAADAARYHPQSTVFLREEIDQQTGFPVGAPMQYIGRLVLYTLQQPPRSRASALVTIAQTAQRPLVVGPAALDLHPESQHHFFPE